MKYCEECNIIAKDNAIMCPKCKRDILKTGEPKGTFPVTIVRATGFEYQRICGALEGENIPYSSKAVRKKFANNAVTGKTNAEYDVMVPYAFFSKAFDLLVGINALDENSADFIDLQDFSQESEEKSLEFDGEDYYSTKNKIVRILSVILMIIVVAGVIYGVDIIMALIKSWLQ